MKRLVKLGLGIVITVQVPYMAHLAQAAVAFLDSSACAGGEALAAIDQCIAEYMYPEES